MNKKNIQGEAEFFHNIVHS
jgi:hypothetical protein